MSGSTAKGFDIAALRYSEAFSERASQVHTLAAATGDDQDHVQRRVVSSSRDRDVADHDIHVARHMYELDRQAKVERLEHAGNRFIGDQVADKLRIDEVGRRI